MARKTKRAPQRRPANPNKNQPDDERAPQAPRPLRFPIFSVTLLLLILLTYVFYSNGTFYSSAQIIPDLGVNAQNYPLHALTFPFAHIGFQHLATNVALLALILIPLELAAGPLIALLVSLLAALLSASAFVLLAPYTLLVGASALVTAGMGSLIALKPSTAVPWVLIAFALTGLIVSPVAATLVTQHALSLGETRTQLSQERQTLVAQNQTAQATVVAIQQAKVEQKLAQTESGEQREITIPADSISHVVGFLTGFFIILYLNADARGEWKERASRVKDGVTRAGLSS